MFFSPSFCAWCAPLLSRRVSKAQLREKGRLWRQKAALAAKPMVGSLLDADRAARADQLKRYHRTIDQVRPRLCLRLRFQLGFTDMAFSFCSCCWSVFWIPLFRAV
jgi:hypothetical protein